MSSSVSRTEFLERIDLAFDCHDIEADSAAKLKLWTYYLLTQDWGNKQNVTANMSFEDYFRENILDPAVALKTWQLHGFKPRVLADFGAGGGYVGITAKILDPNLKFLILLESIRKKVSFMRHCARELALGQVEAIQERAESWRPHSSLECIVSRATWSWKDYQEIGQRYLKAGVSLLSFEGAHAHASNSQLPDTIFEYELQPYKIRRYLYAVISDSKPLSIEVGDR